jgi:N-acetylglucosaminyldiphosphoundecaprenol N-acetyl-beta-D-mannosaminyltransferase
MTAAPNVERVNVLGVGVSAINLDSGRQIIAEAIRDRSRGYITVTGVHGVMEAQDDPALRSIFNKAFLVTPDGMPMVWMSRLAGKKWVGRVYGPDLMLEVCGLPGVRHFLFGGSNGTVAVLESKLKERFPAIQIVGASEPPWRPLNPEEERALQHQVARSRPDVFWVGLSTPKQERFMAEYLPKLDVTLMVGVGAAFDFHSGRIAQAPGWMQVMGLEWFFRLCQEPRRLWRRYLGNNPRFLYRALGQLLGLRKFSLD